MIKIADDLSLPNDAVTQSFAQIGRRGAGKTYLASMIAEQMIDAGAQIIVIDPIGNWWGLRVNADGKSKGKDIFIIGGSHGDVPLAPEAGIEIAKLLIEKNISVVLDISEFRKNERKRFVTDFAEEFYHLKKNKPSAVHIFLEESQKFVPQVVQKDEARMLGAWEDIVRLGRNCGIGSSLISQRPQSIIYVNELKRRGLVEGNNELTITSRGLEQSSSYEEIPTDPRQLLGMWMSKLKSGPAKMLEIIFNKYPDDLTKEDLSEESGYSLTSSTFMIYVNKLKSRKLIKLDGDRIRLSEEFHQ